MPLLKLTQSVWHAWDAGMTDYPHVFIRIPTLGPTNPGAWHVATQVEFNTANLENVMTGVAYCTVPNPDARLVERGRAILVCWGRTFLDFTGQRGSGLQS